MSVRLLVLAILALSAAAAEYDISDEEFYQMPRLFHLDHYTECLARRGVYCVGSFELTPDHNHHKLYQLMQRYSANEVDHFNHTQLHRGLCVSRRCPRDVQHQHEYEHEQLDAWFSSCVNASTRAQYGLSARLTQLQYCERGGEPEAAPLPSAARAFAALVAALCALAALATLLDQALSEQQKKKMEWALSWSVPGCWRALRAERSGSLDVLDGLRVLGMLCFIVEHVCWLNTTAYLADTRPIERMHAEVDGILVSNSTLMVQAFFLMSSFLLADKLLRQRSLPLCSTICDTLVNRIVRMSPSYSVVVWFAASWWARLGSGPLWAPLVAREGAVCARKWPAHLLYLNNLLRPDDKCLIQTWYLAADMQLYVGSLALTVGLLGVGRWAVPALGALLGLATAAQLALALAHHLVPTHVLHRPEAVRALYAGEPTFNVLYQSPLGNVPGALCGLLLAHTLHALRAAQLNLARYKVFRWSSWLAPWLAAGWMVLCAKLGSSPVLVATERTVFAVLVALALLGALSGVQSPVAAVLSWRGWAVPARLSFGALLLHMVVNKTLLASRLGPATLDHHTVILEWFGVAVASYLAALPLALLVELPAQRLHRALCPPPRPAPTAPAPTTTAPAPTATAPAPADKHRT